MREENQDALRKFNEEWDRAHSTEDSKPPLDPASLEENNSQSLMQSINTNIAQGSYVPPTIPTTGNTCDQCGTMHPPIRPGEKCPVAAELKGTQPTTESPSTTVHTPDLPSNPPPRPNPPPPQPQKQQNMGVDPEPAPLAENNIPTEIHINKYLANWSDMIQAHCTSHGIFNTKKLMRHLTIEITEFLENYKGK